MRIMKSVDGRRGGLLVLLALLVATTALGTSATPVASAQMLPPDCPFNPDDCIDDPAPVPACGPGQKPSRDKCFPPAACRAGDDPVRDECIATTPLWPDPAAQTQECVSYYTYTGTTDCRDISSHYTYGGLVLPIVPTPNRVSYCHPLSRVCL